MRKKIIIALAFLFTACGLSFYNATRINNRQLKVREETIVSSKFDQDLDGFLICFFSDLYYGEFKDSMAELAIGTIERFKPDIVIFGGDLISPYASLDETEKQELFDRLSALDVPYGKYAIRGDNDQYDLLSDAGFVYLDNRSKLISLDADSYFNIVGADSRNIDTSAFYGLNDAYYTFLIAHYPDSFESLKEVPFDYMLAGHSRGGQVYIPLISLFRRENGCQKYFRGKTSYGPKILDISNGVGKTLNDARFLADAEIVFYKLKSAEKIK